MRKTALSLCLPLSVFMVSTALSLFPGSAQALQELSYNKDQSKTAQDILETLNSQHYRRQNIDDSLSQRLFDEYLDRLDPYKAYFQAQDIALFSEYKRQFDDQLRAGSLDAGYDIFNLFRQRLSDRTQWILDQLNSEEYKVDFGKDEELNLDPDLRRWAQSKADLDEFWRKRLKSDLLNLKLADKNLDEAKKTLKRRYGNLLKRVEQQDTHDAFEAYMNALGALYDPHTNYLSPRTMENFNINMSLSLEGIGAVLQTEDEYTKVVRIVSAGPADKQGDLKPSDRIVAVGQGREGEMVDVIGWRLDEVVQLIRGKKGSLVRLQVLPDGDDSAYKIVEIRRNKVKLEEQAAQSHVFEVSDGDKLYKLGVIDLPAFYLDFSAYRRGDPNFKSTTKDVLRLLNELKMAKVDGIILDLRNNGGGSLEEATWLTDLFIHSGTVVQIRRANQSISRTHRSRRPPVYQGPLMVLTNRLSASASEIFAGAIQDYGRGLVVGTQTFGKGSVQSLSPVHQGRLKITESKFYRVSGDSTQHRGVLPDIALPTLVDVEEVGESAYDNALAWDTIHRVPHGTYDNIADIKPALKKLHQDRVDKDPDFIHLLSQLDIIEKQREKKFVSLNEDTRRAEKKAREEQAFALENKRRTGKGMEPFADIEAYKNDGKEEEENESEETAAQTQEPESRINPDKDPLLMESGYIMADFIRLQSERGQYAKRPQSPKVSKR
ncbi:carboxy terminal-processing peptidase [Pseudoteredinibacter isoporae]|uniref:Carboxyl-terminal processing protease n=1 Tax=Pseudoteredinibacter isoporae TaxID=570281 RepID=A0A7X0JX14_9GAMM|nr:carboxy terminal-processing peptidase [Pseudoteredinibacter isoporae]MBB6523075.1 carboxyl-terminal processing protease [Pseudoteredinibacter isoporae]